MGQWMPAERVRVTEISREVRAEKGFKKMLKNKDFHSEDSVIQLINVC